MSCVKPTTPYVFSKVSSSVLFLKGSRICRFEILNIPLLPKGRAGTKFIAAQQITVAP